MYSSRIPSAVIQDFPDRNTFLTPEETECVKQRIDRDRGDAVFDDLTWAKSLEYLKDLKLYSFGICFMGATLPGYVIVAVSHAHYGLWDFDHTATLSPTSCLPFSLAWATTSRTSCFSYVP